MISDLTFPSRPFADDSLPPPAWLVGAIITTLIFVGAALLVAIPHQPRPAPEKVPGADIILHSGIVEVSTPSTASRDLPVPFDPTNLSLPIL